MSETSVNIGADTATETKQNPFVFPAGFKPTELSINESLSKQTTNVKGVYYGSGEDFKTESDIHLMFKDSEGVSRELWINGAGLIECLLDGLKTMNIK